MADAHVDVLPLQPPFYGEVVFISLEDNDKQLALSAADAAQLKALLGTEPTGRVVTLSACADNLHIRVEVKRS